MEEILGLLIIIAVSIFKAVNKKLEKSGTPTAPAAPAPEQENPFDFKRWIEEAPKAVEPVTPAPKPIMEVAEEKPEKEKIDPKKLIIYSEIMTPKCMNNN